MMGFNNFPSSHQKHMLLGIIILTWPTSLNTSHPTFHGFIKNHKNIGCNIIY